MAAPAHRRTPRGLPRPARPPVGRDGAGLRGRRRVRPGHRRQRRRIHRREHRAATARHGGATAELRLEPHGDDPHRHRDHLLGDEVHHDGRRHRQRGGGRHLRHRAGRVRRHRVRWRRPRSRSDRPRTARAARASAVARHRGRHQWLSGAGRHSTALRLSAGAVAVAVALGGAVRRPRLRRRRPHQRLPHRHRDHRHGRPRPVVHRHGPAGRPADRHVQDLGHGRPPSP